ncbi:hypothetical protein DIPPA_02346 [Diplonema papillatum]|nr:hypothetical protein DIPPA_02346 [Diplonema papillatum]
MATRQAMYAATAPVYDHDPVYRNGELEDGGSPAPYKRVSLPPMLGSPRGESGSVHSRQGRGSFPSGATIGNGTGYMPLIDQCPVSYAHSEASTMQAAGYYGGDRELSMGSSNGARGGSRQPAPTMDHPGAKVVLGVLGPRAKEDPSALMAAPYFRSEALDAIASLLHGLYLTSFEKQGVDERYYRIATYIDPYHGYNPHVTDLCLAKHASPRSQRPKEQFPLQALMGVQTGAGSPGFEKHRRGNFVRGVDMPNKFGMHPQSFCFTLWFKSGTGYRSVDFAAANVAILERCVAAFDALRAVNSASNYTFGKSTPLPDGQQVFHWQKKGGMGCSIL